MLSQPSVISRLEISGAKYFFVYLEPCKLTWVASFSSPCASTHPYALSRFILSEPLFICPPDTLHPLHDGCMPLHTIHPGFSPLYASPFCLMLQTSPQLMKTPKAQSGIVHHLKVDSLMLQTLKMFWSQDTHTGPHFRTLAGSFLPSVFAVLCPGLVSLSYVYLCSPKISVFLAFLSKFWFICSRTVDEKWWTNFLVLSPSVTKFRPQSVWHS